LTPRERDEYRALRATIRERGTARLWLFAAGFIAWAGLVLATAATMTLPIATLLPLLVLAGVFETILAMHLGVERIGRYLQVFYEEGDAAGERRWEHVAMTFGRQAAKGTPDPIFVWFFLMATLTNFVPAVLAGAVALEWGVVGTVHLLFAVRVLSAKSLVAGQRAADLARFTTLRESASKP
jgi:cell division protein FtsW (lipid II flippase)